MINIAFIIVALMCLYLISHTAQRTGWSVWLRVAVALNIASIVFNGASAVL